MKIAINRHNLSEWSKYVLGTTLLLIRLPPFYLTSIHSIVFMSHTIARFLILVSFFIMMFIFFVDKKSLIIKDRRLFLLIIIYFVSQSISVINAQNIYSFLLIYNDLFFSLLFFLLLFFTVKKNNIYFFVKVLVAASVINFFFQFITYFFPQITYTYLRHLFYEKYWQMFDYQFQRNRFFGDSFDEIILPIIIFYLIKEKKLLNKTFYIALLSCVVFIAFLSNWRSKLLMLFFSFFISAILYLKKKLNYLLSTTFILTITVIAANFISLKTLKSNILDRLTLTNEIETKTIVSRIDFWSEAWKIGLSYPIIGVGVGNYYDNLTSISQQNKKNSIISPTHSLIIIEDPHNIFFSTFSTTGFFGLFSLILLVGYLIYSDYKLILNNLSIRKNKDFLISLIISFWTLFLNTLFNPWLYFSFLSLFWSLRGIIESLKIYYDNEKK